MKYFLFLLSIVSFTWLLATLVRLPEKRVPWCVIVYLLAHALFVAGTWWSWIQAGEGAENSLQYKQSYFLWATVLMGSMVIVAIRYACERDPIRGLFVFSFCACFSLCVSQVLSYRALEVFKLKNLTPTIQNHFTLASVLLTCGFVMLLSLANQSGGIECSIKLALACFWLSFAAYQYFFAIGNLNPYMQWATRQHWFPTLAAIACCLWLSVKLNSGQSELSFQPLPHVTAAEYRTLEPSFERREL